MMYVEAEDLKIGDTMIIGDHMYEVIAIKSEMAILEMVI